MLLKGRVAVITGARKGIGNSIAKLFSREGATVVGLGLHMPDEAWWSDFRVLDVSSFDECKHICGCIEADYGRIDVLVNCAGITRDALTSTMSEELFDEVVSINLKGTWNMVRFVGPAMQRRGGGSIVNISSIVGEYGNIGQSNYAATKAGIIGMTKSWAKEFAFRGGNVRVNAIAPGFIMTDMLEGIPDKLLKRFEGQAMLGRLGQPEEIANVALFLASDMSSYVTGAVIDANGGLRL